MLGYQVPEPDQAMLISGGKVASGAPFRVVTGHGAFVVPFFRKARFLSLSMSESEVAEACVTSQGIALDVNAVIAFKVGSDEGSIIAAGQRFLSSEDQMPLLVGRIFAGHLRSIVGSMTVEEIVTQRQKLAEAVLEGSAVEMGKIGLSVDAFQIQKVSDKGLGYIDAMAAPHNAAIQQAASIAKSAADQAAAQAQQASVRAQADYARETTVTQAGYQAEVQVATAQAEQAAAQAQQASVRAQADYVRETTVAQAGYQAEVQVATAQAEQAAAQARQESARHQADYARTTEVAKATFTAETSAAQAQSAQAGPLAMAVAQQAVLDAQTVLAQRQAVLREQQLIAEIVKPAEAEAQRVGILAQAEAAKTTVLAEAAASNNRVSLDQLLIEQLPLIVEKAGAALAGANLTVLNGAEGVGEVAASLVGQGLAIFETIRTGIGGTSGPAAGAAGAKAISS